MKNYKAAAAILPQLCCVLMQLMGGGQELKIKFTSSRGRGSRGLEQFDFNQVLNQQAGNTDLHYQYQFY